MTFDEKLDFDYLAMSDLINEIGSIVQDTFYQGHDHLSSSDIEHILKITSDVICRIKSQMHEITM